jgi:uncharacterized protein (DUF427 family)
MMVKAIWKNKIIAESEKTEIIEDNYYFPPDSVKKEFLKESNTHYTCPWKGTANYYDVKINGDIIKDAAWYYPEPKPAAKKIKNYVAFWKGIEIIE